MTEFDDILIDIIYFCFIGIPSKKLSSNQKIMEVSNKIITKLFNLDSNTKFIFSFDDFDKLTNHIKVLTQLYSDSIVKLFTDKKNLLDMNIECRQMRKQLYEKGAINQVILLYPSYKNAIKNTSISIASINGEGTGAIINIEKNNILIISNGTKYKISDIVIGFYNNEVYIFKITSLKDIESTIDKNPIHLDMPLHTQIYKFFSPDEFDNNQVKLTKQMIDQKGIDFTIKYYIGSSLLLDKNNDSPEYNKFLSLLNSSN